MKKINVGEIREACILHVLLDCKMHSTQDIIDKTNDLLNYYRNKPPIDKSAKLNDYLISTILKNF